MIQIVYQRKKCIGCNYCIELAPDRWMMNKKDGKSVLLGSKNKKGFYTAEVHDQEYTANSVLGYQTVSEHCGVPMVQV